MRDIYYQFYLFYQSLHKKFPFINNRLEATWAIGISEGFLLTGLLNFLLMKYLSVCLDKNLLFALAMIVVAMNYVYFDIKKNGSRAVKEKPLFLNNKRASKTITILFFSTCIVIFLLSIIAIKSYFNNCNRTIVYLNLFGDILKL